MSTPCINIIIFFNLIPEYRNIIDELFGKKIENIKTKVRKHNNLTIGYVTL